MAGDQPLDAEAAAFRPVDPHVIVLFGITGDLAKRKLLPGLLHLCEAGLMPDFRLVGATRRDLDDEELRQMAREACEEFGRVEVTEENWGPFAERIVHANTKDGGASALADAVAACEKELGGEPRRLHYLSVPPTAALPTRPPDRRGGLRRAARGSSWRSRSAPTSRARAS